MVPAYIEPPYEPLAKVVSGDLLPHSGAILSWISFGISANGTTIHLIPTQKRTRSGIATHPPRLLQVALITIHYFC